MFIKTLLAQLKQQEGKLLQRSVRLLNTPPHKTPIKLPTDTQTPVTKPPLPLPPLDVTSKELDIPMPTVKSTMQPLPLQQCLLPQNNPFRHRFRF